MFYSDAFISGRPNGINDGGFTVAQRMEINNFMGV